MIKKNNNQFVIFALLLIIMAAFFWNYFLPRAQFVWSEKLTSTNLPNPDFYGYYTAGKSFQLGLNPYLDNGVTDHSLSDSRDSSVYSRYIYLPFALPFYKLLAGMDYDSARALWLIINCLAYLTAIITIMSCLAKNHHFSWLMANIFFVLVSSNFIFHIRQGQIDMLVIGLILLSFVSYQRGGKIMPAILLALATLIKINPVFLLLYFIIYKKDLRFLLNYAVSCVGLVLLSLISVPVHLYKMYIKIILPSIGKGSVYFYNQSLFRPLSTIIPNERVLSLVLCFLLILVFGSLCYFVWRRKIKGGFVDTAFLALNLLGVLLITPFSWHMAYVWILIPIILLLYRCYRCPIRISYIFILPLLVGTALVVSRIDPQNSGPLVTNFNLIGAGTLFLTISSFILSQPKALAEPQDTICA